MYLQGRHRHNIIKIDVCGSDSQAASSGWRAILEGYAAGGGHSGLPRQVTGLSRIVRACCLLVALHLSAALRWRLAVEREALLAGHRAGSSRVQLDGEKKVDQKRNLGMRKAVFVQERQSASSRAWPCLVRGRGSLFNGLKIMWDNVVRKACWRNVRCRHMT
jgi:hypothetical protein